MAKIEWDKPVKEKMTFNIVIDTDENGDLEKISLSDSWNLIENPERIRIFSKMVSDLSFWVNLDEFTSLEIKYAGNKDLREANRKNQAEIKEMWKKKRKRATATPSVFPLGK
jgi:hypothetical protein